MGMEFDRSKSPKGGDSGDESLGAAGEFQRRLGLVSAELSNVVEKLRTLMTDRDIWSLTAIGERGALPTLHLECSCDGANEPLDIRMGRGVEIVRGAAMRDVESAIAAAYAAADKKQLGIPPEASNDEFLRAINRELERNPMRGVFFLRAVKGIEETGEPYSDLARLGRCADARGEYRVVVRPEAEEVELWQGVGTDGELGALQVLGALGADRRYRFDLSTGTLTWDQFIHESEMWSDDAALVPTPAEEHRILADLNDLSGLVSEALSGVKKK